MNEITDKLYDEANNISNLVRTIDIIHGTSQLNVKCFLEPIFTLPEYHVFQHVAENCNDKYIKESYAIFLTLIDDLNIEVKD